MAENEVRIIVTSENRTKEGFSSAKADAEKAGDDAGHGFMSKFSSWLVGGQTQFSGGIGGIFSTAFSAGPVGIGAIAAAAGGLLVELDGLVSGFTAAAAGAGAFYILGHQTISNLISDYGALNNAQVAVQKAQDKYNLDPTKQNLKALQTAQLNQQAMQAVAQQDLGAAAPAVDKFAAALGNLQQKFQPVLFKVIGTAFDTMTKFLPTLIPLATAFANAFDPLLVKLGQFAQTKGFQDWFKQFLGYVGPATQAIGTGLGQVASSFGKLLTVLPAPDVVRAIGLAFDAINSSLIILAGTIKVIMGPLSALASLVSAIAGSGGNYQGLAAGATGVAGLAGKNFSGLASLPNNPGRIPALGPAPYTGPGAGKIGHLAGGGYGSGWTLVGENGPELLNLPGGSYVRPAGSFSGGGGGTQVVLQFSGSGGGLDALFIEWLKQAVRARGGGGRNSVQIALGQTH